MRWPVSLGGKPKISTKTVVVSLFFLLFLGLIVAGLSTLFSNWFNQQDSQFIENILSYGLLGLIIYTFYVALAAVIVPLPTLPIDVVLLTIANPWLVIGLRLFGGLLGSVASFYIARVYGRPFLKRVFSKRTYVEIDALSHHLSWWHFLIIALFPLMNTEIMAYAAGLSRLKISVTLLALSIALGYRLLIVIAVTGRAI